MTIFNNIFVVFLFFFFFFTDNYSKCSTAVHSYLLKRQCKWAVSFSFLPVCRFILIHFWFSNNRFVYCLSSSFLSFFFFFTIFVSFFFFLVLLRSLQRFINMEDVEKFYGLFFFWCYKQANFFHFLSPLFS